MRSIMALPHVLSLPALTFLPRLEKAFLSLCANAVLIVFATILIAIKQACTFAFLMLSVKKNCLALDIDG